MTRVPEAQPGSVTWIQRFSSSLALNAHFHALVLDGVYTAESSSSKPIFRALPAPTQQEMRRVIERVHRRVFVLLQKRGLVDDGAPDALADGEPLLAACAATSIQGRVAHGERAGSVVERLRTSTPTPRTIGTRCVEIEGFNLHANVRIPGRQRARVERLCRYVGRPPLALERLGPLRDGRIGYRLKRPWSDGTTFVVFSRTALIEKLVALVPPPRVHQTRYHGVLAPHAHLRPLIVPACPDPCAMDRQRGDCRHSSRLRWAELMRVFAMDVLMCPKCSGRMYVIATITDRALARRILQSCGLSQGPPPSFSPPRLPRQAAFEYEYVAWDG